MLGLSIGKILFTILVVVAIWKGFAMVSRLANERQAAATRHANADARKRAGAQRARAIELQECPRCGAFVDPREGCHCGVRHNEARRV